MKHLQDYHPTEFAQVKPVSVVKRGAIDKFVRPSQKIWALEEFEEELLLWILESGVGYTGVENRRFRKIFEYLLEKYPKLKLHKATYYRSLLDEKFLAFEVKLREYLSVR
jgi:hypothetical protein